MPLTISSSSSSSSTRTRIASAIVNARSGLGWTQAEMAERAGIKAGRVKRAEDGSAQSHATLAAIWKALDAAGARELGELRQAVEQHQAATRRAWRHLDPVELGPMLPDTIRLKVTSPGGVYLPGGQLAPEGAVVTLKNPSATTVKHYIAAVRNKLMEPAGPEDGEALEMHHRHDSAALYLIGDTLQKAPGLGWGGKWTRLGQGGLQAALDADRAGQQVPSALSGFVNAAKR